MSSLAAFLSLFSLFLSLPGAIPDNPFSAAWLLGLAAVTLLFSVPAATVAGGMEGERKNRSGFVPVVTSFSG